MKNRKIMALLFSALLHFSLEYFGGTVWTFSALLFRCTFQAFASRGIVKTIQLELYYFKVQEA